jgi:phosphatidate cytidylyltransferase
VTEGQTKRRSDLGIRTLSGVVMMGIAITAIWFGGYAYMALVVLVGIGVYWEFAKLVLAFTDSLGVCAIWLVGGLVYVTVACLTLLILNSPYLGRTGAMVLIGGVIGTDVGAYFAGRTFGGPKIAPKISPSKTWSGLIGGMVGASVVVAFFLLPTIDTSVPDTTMSGAFLSSVLYGSVLAIVAQSGDFFESWMKRRAGVKDSGSLIPGHGGLFDRTDGLIAVAFASGLFMVPALGLIG